MIIWKDELENIDEMLTKGVSLENIGVVYGVSKQRIYQVLQKYGIDTPQRTRTTFLKDKEPKYYWLNKMLIKKGFTGDERTKLLANLPLPDKCPVLGMALNYDGTGIEGNYTRADNSPSIDQIEAGKGYTADNIAVVSWRANRIKNDGTWEEHEKIANWMKKELQES